MGEEEWIEDKKIAHLFLLLSGYQLSYLPKVREVAITSR